MKALVTGHKGFIGRHLCPALDAAGYDVYGCDLKDGDDCRWLFRTCGTRFDLVVHLAAIVGGRMTIEGDPLSVATNLSLDSEMFAWAVRTQQPRVVYFSSSAAYPESIQVPEHKCSESDIDFSAGILLPDETYGWAKLSGEVIGRAARREGVKVHIVRPFSSFGPDQDLGYPIPDFLERAVQRENPFTLWGTGKQVRDYVWIEDLVATVLKMVAEGYEGPLNIGSGRPTDFWELARIVTGAAGYSPEIVADTTKPVGVAYRCCDTTLSHQFYEPKVSLEEAIARCWAWKRQGAAA